MESFIKKIFEGKSDELVHIQFQKFSRGTFSGRALVKASASKTGFSIGTTAEYANDLVRSVAQLLGSAKANITGVVVSTADLTGRLPFSDKKQFMGIKQYVISGEMSGSEIVKLCDSLPEAFFALSFKAGDTELKIKPKAPKSAKPNTSEAGPKADFCKLKTTNKELASSIVFENLSFKKAEISHAFVITDIAVPATAKTPEEMRRLAQRSGKIVRKANFDGKESVTEKNFVA